MAKRKKILVHSCCAPCATHVYRALKEDGYEVVGFFYNPNIHGEREFKKRLKSMKDWARMEKIKIIVPTYNMNEYFETIIDYEKKHHREIEKDKKRRCPVCFALRLGKTAFVAKEKGFDYFTTTLLVSPFQDQSLLWQIGSDAGVEAGIDFLFKDFRKGYAASRHLSRSNNLYMQNYCGCVYSIDEKGNK